MTARRAPENYGYVCARRGRSATAWCAVDETQRAPWVEDARPVAIPPQHRVSPTAATGPLTKPLTLPRPARTPRERRLLWLFIVLVGLTVAMWTPLVLAALGWWVW